MSISSALFTIVPIAIGVVVVLVLVLVAVNIVRVRRAGHNPLTLQTDIASRLLDSELLERAPTKEAQLAELDALHAAGRITDAELRQAREAVLGT